jgi:hypothetical protein
VEESGSYSTDFVDPEDVHSLTDKCRVAAGKWAPVAKQISGQQANPESLHNGAEELCDTDSHWISVVDEIAELERAVSVDVPVLHGA